MKDFNQFWEVFDYKKGKAEAADTWLNVYSSDLLPEILRGAEIEEKKDLRFRNRAEDRKWHRDGSLAVAGKMKSALRGLRRRMTDGCNKTG